MSFEAALAKRLLDDNAAKARAGTRVDWMRRPGRELDAYTLQIISDVRPQHYKGFQGVRTTRVQLDCWSATFAGAIALRDIAIAVLTPAAQVDDVRFDRAAVPSVRPGFDGDSTASEEQPRGELYREIIDFIFLHNG
jgi:hypothetical protein